MVNLIDTYLKLAKPWLNDATIVYIFWFRQINICLHQKIKEIIWSLDDEDARVIS